ncbi:MAG TPA: DUF2269 family protein [Polyangiaceae bacterium]|nr:DUF2269 family protein [Polyangiaceae bacterium]
MALLAIIHVLAAVIGVGPTYFFPALLRSSLPPSELRGVLELSRRLARYPQIGGPVAVVSGIALVFAIDPHLFSQKWIIGSIVLFVAIQVVVMAFAVPATKKLAAWAFHPANANANVLPPEAESHYRRLRAAHTVAAVLGTVLFGLMIAKPV